MTGTDPTKKRVYLTRHAQAEHNVTQDWTIRDAPLTDLGRKQCRELNDATKDSIQKNGELLLCSPLRRTMETMLIGYPNLMARLESQGKPPILWEMLQEVANLPCDTPLYPLSEVQNSLGGIFSHLDFNKIPPDYASKQGIYDPQNAPLRAREVRKWIRSRPEGEVVVVAHGDILRFMVDGKHSSRTWNNTEIKVFTFESIDDEEARFIELPGGEMEPKDATRGPTTSEMI